MLLRASLYCLNDNLIKQKNWLVQLIQKCSLIVSQLLCKEFEVKSAHPPAYHSVSINSQSQHSRCQITFVRRKSPEKIYFYLIS